MRLICPMCSDEFDSDLFDATDVFDDRFCVLDVLDVF